MSTFSSDVPALVMPAGDRVNRSGVTFDAAMMVEVLARCSEPVKSLVETVRIDYAFSTYDVSPLVGVSYARMRRTQLGQRLADPWTPDEEQRLRTFVAFCDVLRREHVEEPAAWFATRVVENVVLTPMMIAHKAWFEAFPWLWQFATNQIPGPELLNEFFGPGWKRYRLS